MTSSRPPSCSFQVQKRKLSTVLFVVELLRKYNCFARHFKNYLSVIRSFALSTIPNKLFRTRPVQSLRPVSMAITTAISDLVDFIYQTIASVFNGIYGIIHAILSTITGLLSGILHVVGNAISSLGSVVSSITGFIAGQLIEAIENKTVNHALTLVSRKHCHSWSRRSAGILLLSVHCDRPARCSANQGQTVIQPSI